MRVLVACEYSGRVREAFRARGHDAWSCDLLPSEDNSPNHYIGDVVGILGAGWDLMVAHPPCTHLAVSGARWFKDKQAEQAEALEFVQTLMDAPIPRIAIENPVSIISSRIRPADQVIQPWQFGEGEVKTTCLWLKGLPKLIPTHKPGGDLFTDPAPEGRYQRCWLMPPGADRWKERSRTYQGIADAMADQWCGVHVANMNLVRTRFKHVGGAASIAKTMAFHTGESMPKGYRPDLIRAGRPPKLSRVIAQCNADAERMRREAEQRAKTDKPAPVVLKGAA